MFLVSFICRWLNRLPVWILSSVAVTLLLLLTLLPSPEVDTDLTIPMLDKIVHFLMFGLVAWALIIDYGRARGRLSTTSIIIIAILTTLLGAIIEVLQSAMNLGRSGDLLDLWADMAGAFILPLIMIKLTRKIIDANECQLIPVSRRDKHALSKLQTLYTNSFPPEERRQWESLTSNLFDADKPFTALKIVSHGRFAGFITSWALPCGRRYVEHFAVDPSIRGRGIGGKAISKFVSSNKKSPVILEVEPINLSDEARSRINFYRRNGFTDHPGFRYIQPPYDKHLPSVELTLMTSDTTDAESLSTATRQIHEIVYDVADPR